jgi:hypothetical protein
MIEKSWEDMTEEEFEDLLAGVQEEEFEQVTAEEFFRVLAAMDRADAAAERIRLKGRIENGQFVFAGSDQVRVQGNELWVAGKRIAIELEEAAISAC